jgi:hypothetical protein
MEHFSYQSEQIHSMFNSGKGVTQRNLVSIQDGQGIKVVETYSASGKELGRVEKDLTKEELHCIKKNKFIPGLFKDCIKPLSLPNKARPKHKTRRNRNK